MTRPVAKQTNHSLQMTKLRYKEIVYPMTTVFEAATCSNHTETTRMIAELTKWHVKNNPT